MAFIDIDARDYPLSRVSGRGTGRGKAVADPYTACIASGRARPRFTISLFKADT